MGHQVRQTGNVLGKAGVKHYEAHRVGVARPELALVEPGEELGLVGGHVYLNRAIALAALTGEAEVEGIEDLLALEAVLMISPRSISCRMRARPRVVCFSSSVTM